MGNGGAENKCKELKGEKQIMKANELRIGNWVMTTEIYQWELSDFADWYNDHNSHEFGYHVQPVPLTEEWLLKFGFETYDHHDYFIDISNIGDLHSWFSIFKGDSFYYINEFDVKITYVHQLQNLYFAFMGEELTEVSPVKSNAS